MVVLKLQKSGIAIVETAIKNNLVNLLCLHIQQPKQKRLEI